VAIRFCAIALGPSLVQRRSRPSYNTNGDVNISNASDHMWVLSSGSCRNPLAHGEKEVTMREVIERIETPGSEKRTHFCLKRAIVRNHGDRTGERWLARHAMLR
jgi:hypothetical protein